MKKEIKKIEIINHTSKQIITEENILTDVNNSIILTNGKNWLHEFKIEFEFQDNNETLKIFISDKEKNNTIGELNEEAWKLYIKKRLINMKYQIDNLIKDYELLIKEHELSKSK